ncbi:MAG TPA: hypothetical protein DEB06_08890 [Phycisphaerales bacterium]|nr:hypothetical protein [Phycisphaerales bacterium]
MTLHRPFQATNGESGSASSSGNGFREAGLAALLGLAIASPVLLLGGARVYGDWRALGAARREVVLNATAYERLVAGDAHPLIEVTDATRGRELFVSVCAACHGAQGTGMEGLGKNLVKSDFVALQTDEQLRQFIITGRPDAKPMPMPPRAGRDDLTDEDFAHVVSYVRGLQDPRRMPALPELVLNTAPSESQKASALAAAGGDAELAQYIASGDTLFHSTCIACHGKGGVGIPGNGKALASNEFIRSLDDDALLEFITKGRGPSDPKNTTGIQMPPKGGNPALSEDDILDIISYLRTLQGGAPAAASAKN